MSDENQQVKHAAARAGSELKQTEEAFALIRKNALETIATSKPGETELRENLYRTVQVVDLVKTHLQRVIDAGKVEQFVDAIREKSKPSAS